MLPLPAHQAALLPPCRCVPDGFAAHVRLCASCTCRASNLTPEEAVSQVTGVDVTVITDIINTLVSTGGAASWGAAASQAHYGLRAPLAVVLTLCVLRGRLSRPLLLTLAQGPVISFVSSTTGTVLDKLSGLLSSAGVPTDTQNALKSIANTIPEIEATLKRCAPRLPAVATLSLLQRSGLLPPAGCALLVMLVAGCPRLQSACTHGACAHC